MICPNNFAKEVARASGRKMPDVSDELMKNGFDSVKNGDEIKRINTQKFSSNKVENDNLNSLYNSSDEMLQMAAKAGEYEKVFKKEATPKEIKSQGLNLGRDGAVSETDARNLVKNISSNKDIAIQLQPKADLLKLVKDFSNVIKTPIFDSKISIDKLLNHLADKTDADKRLEYLNLIKPTLENPLFITKENNRYRFVKTFIDSDKITKFLSVIENDKGEFIGITATPIKNTDLKNLLKGNIVWGGDILSTLSTPQIAKQEVEAISETIPNQSIKQAENLAQYRKDIEAKYNIRPIKEFGKNYAEFYHDGKGAIHKLLTERQGQVAGAFEREELGDIDLVWGEVTDPIKHKGYGLAHILDKRMAEFMEQGLSKEEAEAKAIELINKLPDIIKNGEVRDLGNGKVRIVTENYSVGMKKEWKGQEKNPYILTAFENTKESAKNLHSNTFTKGETLPLNSADAKMGASADNSLASGRTSANSQRIRNHFTGNNSTTTTNKSQENILKGSDGKEYPNSIAGRWEKRVDEAFDWAYKNIYAQGVKSGIKGVGIVGRAFGSQSGAKIQRGLEKAFALQDEIGALSRLKSAYYRNNQVARVEAMKIYESLVKLKIDERVALFRMLDGQEVEPNLAGKLRPTYQKLRDKIDERAEQLISLGMLKGENAKENYIKYSYSQYYGKKDGAFSGFGIGKLRARDENLSYEDRVKLGLIEDAAIAVTQTLNSQNNQIQKAILFKSLADEYAVVQPKDGYVKVSDESVGGGVKKYGALAGKYVPSAVYDDLQNAGLVSSIFDVIRPYTDIIDHIKVNLTVKNPATHGYNVLSNSVLAFLHGDLGANLKLMKLLATNKNSFNELLAKAEAMGLDTASDDIEMRNLLMANDEVAKEALKSQNPLGYYIAASWQNLYLTKNSATGRVARSAYAWEDKWFKLARFKKNLDMGMSDEAAFSDANSAYVDYSSHFNPTIKLLDKTGVLPFFHFAVKSSIVVTKAAIKNPAKFAMLQTALIGSGASSLPYWFDSEQKDADNSRLPDWASSNYLPNLFGVKNQVQIGESGLYFNAARAMAGFRLSSIDDITGGGGLIGGLLDILRGRDSWGNDMVSKHDPAIKQLTARLDAFSKQFLPSITLGRYGRQGLAIATGNNPKNAYDEPMGLGELAGRFMGLRMINEKKELRSAAINAKNRYKKAKEKGDEGAMVVALNDFMACKAAASDMGVSLEALMKMKKRDIK